MPNPVSRQVGSFSWGNTSETVSITPVSDATKTLVQAQYRGDEIGMDRQTFSVELASTSTLQFERTDRNGVTEIEWEVVEFDDADLSVEHVSDLAIGVNAIGTKDLTRTVVISNGNTSLAGDDRARNYVELELTAVDELTARYRVTWPVAGVCAQVLQLPAADVESLQVVSTAAVPFSVSITPVDPTKTLTFGTGYFDGTDEVYNSGHGTLDLASAGTLLEAVRSDGTATAITLDYTAYVLELTGSDVQRVSQTFSDTDLSLTASLNPVVAASTSVFAGGWAGNVRFKQGDSLSTGGNSEGAFTATLNGTTGVDFERGVVGTTGASSSPLAQVVEWAAAGGAFGDVAGSTTAGSTTAGTLTALLDAVASASGSSAAAGTTTSLSSVEANLAGASVVGGTVAALLDAAAAATGSSATSGGSSVLIEGSAGVVAGSTVVSAPLSALAAASASVVTGSTTEGAPSFLVQGDVTADVAGTSTVAGALSALVDALGTASASSVVSGSGAVLLEAAGAGASSSGVAGAVTALLEAVGAVATFSAVTGDLTSSTVPLAAWGDDATTGAEPFSLILGEVAILSNNLDGQSAPAAALGNLRTGEGAPITKLGATPSGLELFVVVNGFVGGGSSEADATSLFGVDDGSFTLAFDGTNVYAGYAGGGPALAASTVVNLNDGGVHVIRVKLALPDLELQADDGPVVTDTEGGASYAAFAGSARFYIGGNEGTTDGQTATFVGAHAYLFSAGLSPVAQQQMYDYLALTYPSVAVP
jgi:hypothetical protein